MVKASASFQNKMIKSSIAEHIETIVQWKDLSVKYLTLYIRFSSVLMQTGLSDTLAPRAHVLRRLMINTGMGHIVNFNLLFSSHYKEMLLPMLAINEYDPCTVQMNYCIAKITFTSNHVKKQFSYMMPLASNCNRLCS